MYVWLNHIFISLSSLAAFMGLYFEYSVLGSLMDKSCFMYFSVSLSHFFSNSVLDLIPITFKAVSMSLAKRISDMYMDSPFETAAVVKSNLRILTRSTQFGSLVMSKNMYCHLSVLLS